MENEDILTRRTHDFLEVIGSIEGEDGMSGIDIVKQFNYVTFNIMGEMSFGNSWDLRLKEQPGSSDPVSQNCLLMTS